ncbi:LPXTG cell wall anchor domain-containing protein [Kitasatospora sp. NPDC006697]|uniref:LPXTG cell wall anchor domain-containing protein n=1 Tax=Kitasatospora sp. NPDC006697 TaxID=3364020 RepID=UPI003682FE13
MKIARTTAVGAAALGLFSLQLALGAAAAHADGLDGITLSPWVGGDSTGQETTIAPGDSLGWNIWADSKTAGPINAKVLVSLIPRSGTLEPLPAGISLSFPNGTCVPAADGPNPAAYLCDLSKPTDTATMPPAAPGSGATSRAEVTLTTTSATKSTNSLELTEQLVDSSYTSYQQVGLDVAKGKRFQTSSVPLTIESKDLAAQNTATLQLSDLTAGQTATQTVKVHAVGSSLLLLKTEDGVPGEVWNPSGNGQIDLPQGLDLLSVTTDDKVTCTTDEVERQHLPPVEGNWLSYCLLTPGDTTLTLTFKADAAVKQLKAKLTAGFHVYTNSDMAQPFSSASGTFVVNAAPAASAATTAAPAATSAAPAAPSTAAAVPAAATKASPTATATKAAGGQELAFTGSTGTTAMAVAGAAVLAAGAGIVFATRRRRSTQA